MTGVSSKVVRAITSTPESEVTLRVFQRDVARLIDEGLDADTARAVAAQRTGQTPEAFDLLKRSVDERLASRIQPGGPDDAISGDYFGGTKISDPLPPAGNNPAFGAPGSSGGGTATLTRPSRVGLTIDEQLRLLRNNAGRTEFSGGAAGGDPEWARGESPSSPSARR